MGEDTFIFQDNLFESIYYCEQILNNVIFFQSLIELLTLDGSAVLLEVKEEVVST